MLITFFLQRTGHLRKREIGVLLVFMVAFFGTQGGQKDGSVWL